MRAFWKLLIILILMITMLIVTMIASVIIIVDIKIIVDMVICQYCILLLILVFLKLDLRNVAPGMEVDPTSLQHVQASQPSTCATVIKHKGRTDCMTPWQGEDTNRNLTWVWGRHYSQPDSKSFLARCSDPATKFFVAHRSGTQAVTSMTLGEWAIRWTCIGKKL